MIENVNAALLELQGALTGRALYPPGHPRVRSSELRACDLLREPLAERGEITIFALDERVVFEDTVLPSSGSLVETLFRSLRKNGVDRITFRRGVEGDEIHSLLDDLAAGDSGGGRPRASAHLRFGFIRDLPQPVAEASDTASPGGPTAAMAGALEDVWRELYEDRDLDTDLLGDIVSSVTRAVSDSSSAVLPLASLKKHDEYTFVHTINVAVLSTALCEVLGFKDRVIHELNMSALLHDIGKRMIPKELLNKQGRFTEDEFRLVQLHPVVGARLLLGSAGMIDLAPVVAYEHHIRMDGKGYPKVPAGWRLNLASRIVQVADVFDALRTTRPYRPALPLTEIVEIMRKDVGVFFDEDLLELFFEHVVFRLDPAPVEVDF